MHKLNFQDASFLRAEVSERPFHVAALLVFSRPKDAPANYMQKLAASLPEGVLNSSPLFSRKLKDPHDMRNPEWIDETTIDLNFHFRHYMLPQPGKMEDLLQLVALAHQPLLDRSRPLWEYHLIDGLPRGKFAVYVKMHHSLVDGVAGIKLVSKQLQPEPMSIARLRRLAANAEHGEHPSHKEGGWFHQLENNVGSVMNQARALPEIASQVLHMGRNTDGGLKGLPPLPFTAPACILNQEAGARRQLVALNLPLNKLREIGHSADGTVNDALLAVFGGALRTYLLSQKKLPRNSLVGAMPISVVAPGDNKGNALSMSLCPLGSNIADPQKRLQRIVKVTKNVKKSMHKMSKTGLQDMFNLIMMPVMVLSATHLAGKVRPLANMVVSNVPGPKTAQYLADSKLESIYPISLLTEAAGMNYTALSYRNQVCIGILACPDGVPELDTFGDHMQQAYEDLLASV
jgi:WS/DGAT/MGAT family acyltransferase